MTVHCATCACEIPEQVRVDTADALAAAERRIALALEASYWDRPYDVRINAIRRELRSE